MSKRGRGADLEVFEPIAALLRQGSSRAVDRLRLHTARRDNINNNENNNSGSGGGPSNALRPIDILVLQYVMYYLDLSTVPSTHYVRLAQEVLTSSAHRVMLPRLFARASLSLLCEGLVAEHTADALQDTLKEVEEYVEVRDALGEWIMEEGGAADDEDTFVVKNEYGNNNNSNSNTSALDLAASLYRSLEFWLRVQTFIHALSLGSANAHAFPGLKPRYERDLMLLLHSMSSTSEGERRAGGKAATPPPVAGASSTRSTEVNKQHQQHKSEIVKEEELDGDGTMMGGVIASTENIIYETDGNAALTQAGDDGPQITSSAALQRHAVSTAVLADTLALSNCPAGDGSSSSSSSVTVMDEATARLLKGISPSFYAMVHARLGVMVARNRLQQFSTSSAVPPPQLTVMQRNLQEQEAAKRARVASASGAQDELSAAGAPLDYVPDDQYYRRLLEQQQEEPLGDDEEVYKDEVVDYYLRHPQRQSPQQQQQAHMRRQQANNNNNSATNAEKDAAALVKPHRFCKVKTGFTWTQYNRTHYDSRTNPPPRTVLWYEFTLFYPALANTKRDMRRIFRIEDTPKGPEDDYCLLVFSVGPPYADVAYRIVKKQWDTRRGGVRISFDANGRYKLFFRFTNSNYRR